MVGTKRWNAAIPSIALSSHLSLYKAQNFITRLYCVSQLVVDYKFYLSIYLSIYLSSNELLSIFDIKQILRKEIKNNNMTAEESLDTSKDKFPKDTIVSTNDGGAATELDDSKAKFINGDKEEQEHVIVKVGTNEFNGLTKEELMKYANDPFWVRTRLILFVIFWIGWVAMLVAAIIIIILAPRCPYKPSLKWYHTDVIYEISPRSFKDSNDDGNGDLKGLQQQFPYLASIGVKTLWIHSLFDAKYKDSGFGLINHTAINPTYGTEADITAMIKKFKKDGRHLIADFIPFYTHVSHDWFSQSKSGKKNKMADYYVWIDNVTYSSLSMAEKKIWHLDPTRNEYFLATIEKELPTLNLSNKEVRDELGDILRYWFARGIAGFHINDLEHAMNTNVTAGKATFQKKETLEALYEWRAIADHFSDKPGRERLLFSTVTVTNLNDTMAYYGDENKKGLNFIAASNLEVISNKNTPLSIIDTVEKVLNGTDLAETRGWLLGDQDHSRLMSRVDSQEFLKSMMTLQMLIPGTAFCYYGDEIGMKNIALKNLTDSLRNANPNHPLISHYAYRSPMLWNTDRNSFSNAKPWLLPESGLNSVASQRAYNNRNLYPPLKAFADLNELRSNFSFQWGSFDLSVTNENIFSFVRKAEGFHGYLVAINFGTKAHTVRFHDYPGSLVPEKVKVVFHSMRQGHEFKPGAQLNLVKAPITLHSYEAAVFEFL